MARIFIDLTEDERMWNGEIAQCEREAQWPSIRDRAVVIVVI